MSQITLQGKQQALIRVAESRVAALDAVSSTKKHAELCVNALPISPSVLLRLGAAAGAAATVLGTLSALRSKKKAAEKKLKKQGSPNAALIQLALQALAPAVIPMLHRSLQKWSAGAVDCSAGKSIKF